MFRSVLMVSVILCALTASGEPAAPADNSADVSVTGLSSLELLQRFNQTPPTLDPIFADDPARETFFEQCYAVTAECLAYIRQNRALAQRVLPNNPLYWQNYWAVMEGFEPAYNPKDFEAGVPSKYEFHSLIDASWQWPLHQYATRGAIDVKDTLTLMRHSRRLSSKSQSLREEMISTALIGIGNVVAHQVLWQLGADNNRNAALRIQQLLVDEANKSLRPGLEYEFLLVEELARRVPDDALSNLDEGVTLESFFAEYRLMIDLWSELSERTFSAFWSQGVDLAGSGAVQQPLFSFGKDSSFGPAFTSYVTTLQETWVYARVFAALGDIYAGRVAPGLPARPDPSPWQWQWRDDPEQLCLIPVAVHPSISFAEACVEYLGPTP
ncbi:MAG: hypothetical protein NXH95_05565 [Pseudomonadaceae bacterium]|nr:hypothetical protein [Pseudomonadaceae bacterium]